MTRVPHITESSEPGVRALIDRIREQRGGQLLNLYATLLNSPGFAQGWLALLSAVRNHSSLPAHLRELIILRVARLNGADYEYSVHLPIALREGATKGQVDDLDTWWQSVAYSDAERAVLKLTDEMTQHVHVNDEVFASVSHHFNHQELVEIAVTVAAYNMVSRFLEAMRVDHDH